MVPLHTEDEEGDGSGFGNHKDSLLATEGILREGEDNKAEDESLDACLGTCPLV